MTRPDDLVILIPVVRSEQLDGSHEHPVIQALRAELTRVCMDRDYWKAAAGAACDEIKRLRVRK